VSTFSDRCCVWLLAISLLEASLVRAADPEPGKIEAGEPRVQIRAEILAGTKIGSSPDDVLKFISERFQPKKDTPAPKLRNHPAVGPTAKDSDKKGVRSIRLVLGHYVTSPAMFLMQVPMVAKTTTAVQWAFSSEGKLIEVFVDKDSELGDEKGPND
jgi:hypothetical protein